MKRTNYLPQALALLALITIVFSCSINNTQKAKSTSFESSHPSTDKLQGIAEETVKPEAPAPPIIPARSESEKSESLLHADETKPVIVEKVASEELGESKKDVEIYVAPTDALPSIDEAPRELSTVEISATSPAKLTTAGVACTISRKDIKAIPSISSSKEIRSESARDDDATPRGLDYKEPTAVTVAGASPSSAATVNAALAGKLTAGEINDFQKWKLWGDIASSELDAYRGIWRMNPTGRYSVVVQSMKGSPIIDCNVSLVASNGVTIWETHTDNTGKAELWDEFNMDIAHKHVDKIEIKYDGRSYKIGNPKSFEEGINTIKVQAGCDIPDMTDVLFTVDATGSMGDEISYLQAELVDVINKVKSKHSDIQLRLGSVFYRDHGDTYVTTESPFSTEISETNNFIANQYADGGGDGPEAVDDALAASVNNMKWSSKARARLMFMILDAPPHAEKENIQRLQQYVKLAAQKGIRIIPLVASGGGYDVDKSLEYLMRSCALATNGTYAFLTDHSGVGGAHTAPSTDKYDVETLNALLIRVIEQFLFVPECNVEQFISQQEISDTSSFISPSILPLITQTDSLQLDSNTTSTPDAPELFVMKCYPNPAADFVWVQTSEQMKEIFLADNSGKIIERFNPTSALLQIDVSQYPTGIYHLKAWINDKWASARIVVARI
jgi:hypothetical protein